MFFFIYFKSRNKEKKLWAIFYYIVLSLCTDLLINFNILGINDKVKPFFTFTAFTFLEYTIFSYFFYHLLRTKIFKQIVLGFYPAFIIVAIYSIIYRNKFNFDSFTAQIEAIHIIIFSIFFFYEQLNKPEIDIVYATKDFWVVMAILIYLASTVFLFVLSIYLTKAERKDFWLINDIANIVKNIFLAIAFSKKPVLPANVARINRDWLN